MSTNRRHNPTSVAPDLAGDDTARPAGFPRTSVRIRSTNPNHHLWNNNGTWYLHYTMHPTPLTKQRIRVSLSTKNIEEARLRRDEILARAGVTTDA